MGGPAEQERVIVLGQKSVLDLVAREAPLDTVLATLCNILDDSVPGALSSILLVTDDGNHLRHGAAPQLPQGYLSLLDGIAIGPGVGSCGTAAFTRAITSQSGPPA